MIGLIWAQDRNGGIGQDGVIPWHVPSDLHHFRQTTVGHTVIMGRKTWDSIGGRPLPHRDNIVMSRSCSFTTQGADVAHSVGDALTMWSGKGDLWVIGGEAVYCAFLPVAATLSITTINVTVDHPDAFAPRIDEHNWVQDTSLAWQKDESSGTEYRIDRLSRVR